MMKRLLTNLLIAALAVFTLSAHAQFSPNTVLTAAALNNALANPNITGGSINGTTNITTSGNVSLSGTVALTGPVSLGGAATANTNGFLDSTTLVATDAYVHQNILAATATIPINVTTSGQGVYNFQTAGTGATFSVTTSSGTITSATVTSGGSGYQIGDCLIMVGGNGDGIVRVTSLTGSAVATVSVVYGGTAYGTITLVGSPLPPGSRSANITGVLTSNMTIIIPRGTLLQGARRISFANNTTGAYSITVLLSNGSGGSTGTGTVLAQGSNNSTSILLYTDGVNGVWPEVATSLPGTSASLGGSSLGGGACSTTTVSVPGATTAMAVAVSPVTYPGNNFYWRGYVSSAGTVTVGVCAQSFGTPTASVYNVRVLQ